MKRIAVLLCVLTYLLPCAQRSLAQATAYLTEDETLVNGVLGIQLDCHAYGSWDLGTC